MRSGIMIAMSCGCACCDDDEPPHYCPYRASSGVEAELTAARVVERGSEVLLGARGRGIVAKELFFLLVLVLERLFARLEHAEKRRLGALQTRAERLDNRLLVLRDLRIANIMHFLTNNVKRTNEENKKRQAATHSVASLSLM
jgi:hypothetical protein